MQALKISGWEAWIKDVWCLADRPLLGICLGMQLLLEESDEFGTTKGLGLIPGRVEKMKCTSESNMRLPHVCWNNIYESNAATWQDSVLATTQQSEDVYFIHSYVAKPSNPEHILCRTQYENIEFNKQSR